LIYPAIDTGNLTLRTNSIAYEITTDRNTGRARGVNFFDAQTGKSYEARGKVIVIAASTLESTRLLLLSKSDKYPNGIGNSSGHVGHNFCEHVMGPGATALVEELVGRPRTLDDGRPTGIYIPRFRNLTERRSDYLRGYGLQGGSGVGMFPNQAISLPGFGAAYKKAVRDHTGAYINIGGFGEVLARYENQVSLDPTVRDRWGIPALKFSYRFGDNERKMAIDMADQAAEMLEATGYKVVSVRRDVLTEGWSIHELGTSRMGTDPKSSVLNQFQQSHDVKNLFVVDGSSHVSAGCVNPTWTIMALAMRSCEHLSDQLRKGDL
jgi:choline dehydrogenase-like flavoprotein